MMNGRLILQRIFNFFHMQIDGIYCGFMTAINNYSLI